MRIFTFVNIIIGCIFAVRIIPPHDRSICIFIIRNQYLMPVLIGENRHPIIVIAKRTGLTGSGAAGCMVKFWNIRKQRIPPTRCNMPIIPFGHHDRVFRADADGFETKPACRRIDGDRCQCSCGRAQAGNAAHCDHAP